MSSTCSHCRLFPVIAGKAWEALKEKEFKWPKPTPSESFPGYQKTFMKTDVEQDKSSKQLDLPEHPRIATIQKKIILLI